MALLNTSIAYATIAPQSGSSEFISFTGITQNVNGTATLTGVVRGLDKTSPFTANVNFRQPHAGQSLFILSNSPQHYKKYGALENNEVITGLWEAPNPLTAQGLVTRDWILALINGGAISQDSVIEEGNAGETVAAGNLLYFDTTDNEWKKTDADTIATIFNVKLGIAQGAGTNGNPITNGVLTYGTDTTQTGMSAGDIMYAGNTAGAIVSASGTVPRVIGIAKSATELYFDSNFQNTLYNYNVSTGAANAYALALSPAFNAYYVGMKICFKANFTNTGASTIDINGLGVKTIKINVTEDLLAGAILQDQIVELVYDGTNFQMVSPSLPQTPIVYSEESRVGKVCS